jgi:YbbR domain-containing protein
LRRLLRRLSANWGLKLAALALALLLWVVVSAEQVTTQSLTVPVRVVLRDPRLELSGRPVPAAVTVRFVGTGRDLWELAFRHPEVALPVHDVSEAGVYALDPQMVTVPGRIAVSAQEVQPELVRVSVRRLSVREVPVRVRWQGGAGEHVHVDPARVLVMGERDPLSRLDSVATRPVAVGADSAVDSQVALDPASLVGMRASVASVHVTARVGATDERLLAEVPVEAPPGTRASPQVVSARVMGPAGAVAGISPRSFRARPVPDSVPRYLLPAGAEVPLALEGLPAGVTGAPVPARVRLTPAALPARPLVRDTPAPAARP